MPNRKYLDPAYTIIMKFAGPTGKLAQGIDAVAKITGKDRTRVYRWMRPKDKGGTGGRIPAKQQYVLYDHARRRRVPLQPEDFFGARAA